MRDGLAFLQAQLLQHAVHAVGAEDAHQVVFERQVELGAAGIALAARAAAQLVVDAPALVPLGAEHVEAARLQRLLLLLGDVGQHLGGLGLDQLVNIARRPARRAATSAAAGWRPSAFSVEPVAQVHRS